MTLNLLCSWKLKIRVDLIHSVSKSYQSTAFWRLVWATSYFSLIVDYCLHCDVYGADYCLQKKKQNETSLTHCWTAHLTNGNCNVNDKQNYRRMSILTMPFRWDTFDVNFVAVQGKTKQLRFYARDSCKTCNILERKLIIFYDLLLAACKFAFLFMLVVVWNFFFFSFSSCFLVGL